MVTQSKTYFSCAYVLHKWKSSHVNLYFSAHSIDGAALATKRDAFERTPRQGTAENCGNTIAVDRWAVAGDRQHVTGKVQGTDVKKQGNLYKGAVHTKSLFSLSLVPASYLDLSFFGRRRLLQWARDGVKPAGEIRI